MIEQCLLALQVFQVAFLLLHDWVKLGPLNDPAAVRREVSLKLAIVGTVIGALFPTAGLIISLAYWQSGWPHWLPYYLIAAYGFLFIGELEAWWVPYLLVFQPKKAALYKTMYAPTHSFLPVRNGLTVNTIHVVVHLSTVATLLMLGTMIYAG